MSLKTTRPSTLTTEEALQKIKGEISKETTIVNTTISTTLKIKLNIIAVKKGLKMNKIISDLVEKYVEEAEREEKNR